jgi:predicted nucleic acid-binding protein
MTLVLDSGGVSALAANTARLRQIMARGEWPPMVSAAVLAESLTGDHRRDYHANELLRQCVIRNVSEIIARHAAVLRYASRKSGCSAVDAIVAATADHAGGGIVLTSDPDDLGALAANTLHPVQVAAV